MNELGNTPADKNYQPSGISRAESRAREAYPIYLAKAVMSDGSIIEFDAGETKRNVFKQGYEQAEKDLALTVEDLQLLHAFLYAVKNNKQGVFTFTRLSDEQYQEVLKRFKRARK